MFKFFILIINYLNLKIDTIYVYRPNFFFDSLLKDVCLNNAGNFSSTITPYMACNFKLINHKKEVRIQILEELKNLIKRDNNALTSTN